MLESNTLTITPHKLFSIFATAEMLTWAGLIAALISRATGVADFVSIAGGLHGFIFLSYITVTVFVWINERWKPTVGILGLLLSVIPFATLPFEIYLKKKNLLSTHWRLAAGGNHPLTAPEKLEAWVLQRPILAIGLLVTGVVLVYLVLLFLGPPLPQN